MRGSGGRRDLLSPLPDDLLIEILCLLSIKTLLRLRAVAKSWLSFIDGHTFVRTHLSRSKSNPYLMVVGKDVPHPIFTDTSIFCFRNEERAWFVKAKSITLLSCCDGMLLFEMQYWRYSSKRLFCIVNPATRKVIDLPAFNYGVDTVNWYLRMGQLVFDRASNAYKVVLFYRWPESYCREEVYGVFTLGVDRYWRAFSVPPNCWFHYSNSGHLGWQFPTIHGAIHWMNGPATRPPPRPDPYDRHEYLSMDHPNRNWAVKISAFRVEDERFHMIKGYRQLSAESSNVSDGRGNSRSVHVLAEYRGSLCLLHLDYREHTLEFWVLKDYAKQIWIRQHRLRSVKMLAGNPSRIRLMYYTVDGEIRLQVCDGMGELSFNAQLGTLRRPTWEIRSHKSFEQPTVLGFFTESLVTCNLNNACSSHQHGGRLPNRFSFRDVHRRFIRFCAPGEQREEGLTLQHIVEIVIFGLTLMTIPTATAFFVCKQWSPRRHPRP